MLIPIRPVRVLVTAAAVLAGPLTCPGQDSPQPKGAPAASHELAVRSIEDLLERARWSEQERASLLDQARTALEGRLANPAEADLRVCVLAGRVAVLEKDRRLGARASEGIERLRPDFHGDTELLDLMADLNALRTGPADGAGAVGDMPTAPIAEEPSADLTHFDELRLQGLGMGERVGDVARTGRVETWRREADAGNTTGMTLLGLAYETGAGVEKSEARAIEWYERAAAARSPRAMLLLGAMHESGRGVPEDCAKAASWYREAAELGDATAMAYLADMYRGAIGVAHDPVEARKWYVKAADAGSAEAMFELGLMHASGVGTRANDTEAAKWYRKAADAGSSRGMNNLAVHLERGAGVAKDDAEALAWFRKSARAGNPVAMRNLAFMYASGTGVAGDRAEAERWMRRAGAVRAR